MPTTKTAQATTAASIDHDARQIWCVISSHFVRHEMNRINDLRRTHRAPPDDERHTTTNDERRNRETTDSSGADLCFVRHSRRLLTHNPLTMTSLPLCPKKGGISGLVRHPCARNPRSQNPQPTTHNPAGDADLAFVRHQRPLLTNNRLTMSNLSLCPKKGGISGLVRHPSFPASTSRLPTTHNLQPTSRIRFHLTQSRDHDNVYRHTVDSCLTFSNPFPPLQLHPHAPVVVVAEPQPFQQTHREERSFWMTGKQFLLALGSAAVAHPDDELTLAATVCNSQLAEQFYNASLTGEDTGRSRLPQVRRRETGTRAQSRPSSPDFSDGSDTRSFSRCSLRGRMLKKGPRQSLPRGRGSVGRCKYVGTIPSRARQQAVFRVFQHPTVPLASKQPNECA
jgi:hypothetical protein